MSAEPAAQPTRQTKILALILNAFFPGVGTAVLGLGWVGATQFALYLVAATLPDYLGGLRTAGDLAVAVVWISAAWISVRSLAVAQ